MKAESLSFGIVAIIKREEIRQRTCQSKQNSKCASRLYNNNKKSQKRGSFTQRDVRACQSKQLVNKIPKVLSRYYNITSKALAIGNKV